LATNAPPNPFSGKKYDEYDEKHGGWVEPLNTMCDSNPYGELDVMFGSKRLEIDDLAYGDQRDKIWYTTVEYVARVEGNEDTECVVDLKGSSANRWWLLPTLSACANWAAGNCEWVLINFEEKRMYHGPYAAKVFSWDDPWEIIQII
jgi:hypothetical protein